MYLRNITKVFEWKHTMTVNGQMKTGLIQNHIEFHRGYEKA